MSQEVPLTTSQRSPTTFERRVYHACSLIPEGKVSTYGFLAEVLKSSPRAVGQVIHPVHLQYVSKGSAFCTVVQVRQALHLMRMFHLVLLL